MVLPVSDTFFSGYFWGLVSGVCIFMVLMTLAEILRQRHERV